MKIDIKFDFRTDSSGLDPDRYSKSLKEVHEFLWSKPLPSGKTFKLKQCRNAYLVYENSYLVHFLTSDSIGNSYAGRKNPPLYLKDLDSNLIESFRTLNSTIGAFIIFPGKKVGQNLTINQERGRNKLIEDRFDLTLECIRRFYLGQESPLFVTLGRYSSFFELFINFQGYVDFFLLNDLVSSDYSSVHFFNSINAPFVSPGMPNDVTSYLTYRENSMKFTAKRNLRINEWATAQAT